MKLPRRKFLHLAAGAAALPVVLRIAQAQTYPARPVRIIVPVGPAGALDIAVRLIGHSLSERHSSKTLYVAHVGKSLSLSESCP
jgi:tripartite-type tricarboxylate transporter receptor subunit TctC